MSIGYKNSHNASSSSSSSATARGSSSATKSNLWKVRTPSHLLAAHPHKNQQQTIQDALLAKQRAAAAAVRQKKAQAQAQPLTSKVITIRVPKPQSTSARKQLRKPSLAPHRTQVKAKHDPRAQAAARLAAQKLKTQIKATHSGPKSPVRSVVRLDALGNQRIVLIMQRAVVQEALEKSPRVVTSELRTSPDGRCTNILRFDKTFYGNALVNGSADQLGAIDLSAVNTTQEQLEAATSMLFGIDIGAPSPPSRFTDQIALEPISLDEDEEPQALFADDDEPVSPHRATCTNEFLAWNSAFNTPPPSQSLLPPAPVVFSTAVRSSRMSDWHRGAERYTPYASSRPRRAAVA